MTAGESRTARFELPPERPGRPASPGLAERREMVAEAGRAGLWRTDPPAVEALIGGVRCLRHDRPGARGTVIHFHGGGFRLGSPEMVGAYAAALADRCSVNVVCPAYRLAPEHPFPAGVADGWAVARALAGEGAIVLAGDSAGGGVAASLALLCAGNGVGLAGLALISPWLDLTATAACYQKNAASDAMFSFEAATEAADLYLQGLPADDPLASPVFADLAGLPPAFVAVGTGEVLRDDSRAFHARLVAAGIAAELLEVEAMEHTAVTRDLALTGSAETFDALAGFIGRAVGQRG